MEDRTTDKMWLVKHLEIIRQSVVEDMKVVKVFILQKYCLLISVKYNILCENILSFFELYFALYRLFSFMPADFMRANLSSILRNNK